MSWPAPASMRVGIDSRIGSWAASLELAPILAGRAAGSLSSCPRRGLRSWVRVGRCCRGVSTFCRVRRGGGLTALERVGCDLEDGEGKKAMAADDDCVQHRLVFIVTQSPPPLLRLAVQVISCSCRQRAGADEPWGGMERMGLAQPKDGRSIGHARLISFYSTVRLRSHTSERLGQTR